MLGCRGGAPAERRCDRLSKRRRAHRLHPGVTLGGREGERQNTSLRPIPTGRVTASPASRARAHSRDRKIFYRSGIQTSASQTTGSELKILAKSSSWSQRLDGRANAHDSLKPAQLQSPCRRSRRPVRQSRCTPSTGRRPVRAASPTGSARPRRGPTRSAPGSTSASRSAGPGTRSGQRARASSRCAHPF